MWNGKSLIKFSCSIKLSLKAYIFLKMMNEKKTRSNALVRMRKNIFSLYLR